MTLPVWTPWNGEGPCPVPEGRRFTIQWRCESREHAERYVAENGWEAPERARSGGKPDLLWTHNDNPYDTVAYALEPLPTPEPDWKELCGKLGEALEEAVPALAAAISLLEASPKTGAPSNKMFDQMLADYRAHLEAARAVLSLIPSESGS
jgi:hypothetical protein